MEEPIYVTQSFLPHFEEYTELLKKLWETKHLTNRGEYVVELENKIQSNLNSKSKPLLVSNGTIALQIAIKALDLKGDIITTPFSYVATTSSIVWEGCNPVFVDIDPDYLTIDESKIEAAITEKTSAIIATHVYGNPCNIEAIDKIAKKYNLKVIYDAAHCFGVKYKNKSIFDYGDISTCSFHATKIFHTGEGGAIFCNKIDYCDKIFNYHNFGHDGPEDYHGIGINGKLSEFNAAIGLAILPYIQKIIKNRRKVHSLYEKNITLNELSKIKIRENCNWNFSYYPLIFDSENKLIKTKNKLTKNEIFTRRYFYPSLNKLPYVKKSSLPISEDISKRILCLPMNHSISVNKIKKIVTLIIE